MKMKKHLLISILIMLFAFLPKLDAKASSPTDEITDYEITIDINQDSTVNITYDITWKVLESDGVGPLSWVQVGIPNKKYVSYEPISDNIKEMKITSNSGYYAVVTFDKEYFEGESITFSYKIVQDNMYQVNKYEEGYTAYSFTPVWFDDIDVAKLVIRWDCTNAES